MRCTFAALAVTLASACAPPASEAHKSAGPLVDLVDPTIGTGGFGFAYGASFLGAAAPHGLVKAGPDTTGAFGEINFVHTSGNWAEDATILCFSHLHLHGTGLPDGGVVALMPTPDFDPQAPRAVQYAQTRVNEDARAGRYGVDLAESGVHVDVVAPGPHAARWRFAFPAGGAHNTVVLDLFRTIVGGAVDDAHYAVDGTRVTGSLHTEGGLSPPGGYTVFFALDAVGAPFTAATDTGFGAALDFGGAPVVELAVALSFVDTDGAVANLAAEAGAGASFEEDAQVARAQWAAPLSRVSVFVDDSNGKSDPTMLASALYRTLLMPTQMSDVDGRFTGPDGAVHTTPTRMMTDLSLWDTYRTVQPLYSLLFPDDARDTALSIAAWTILLGHGPLWTMATGDASVMIGSPGELVLADAVARGDVDVDDEALEGATVADAYDVLRAAALDLDTEPPAGRGGREGVVEYDRHGGVVPAPHRAPVSSTLEFAQADTALARLADAAGHDDDADRLRARAGGWRALFDDDTGFLRARDADGAFVIARDAFDPAQFSDDYVEADAWQSLFPLDDDDGVRAVYGGDDGAAARLADLLARTEEDWATRDPTAATFGIAPLPFHWQGNEPSEHVSALPYRFGDDALGARFVSFVLDTQYGARVDGLPGNDDGGALSSFWALASMGLFPVAGSADWVIGAPRFARVEIAGGLTIERTGAAGGTPKRRTVDGAAVGARVHGLAGPVVVELE